MEYNLKNIAIYIISGLKPPTLQRIRQSKVIMRFTFMLSSLIVSATVSELRAQGRASNAHCAFV